MLEKQTLEKSDVLSNDHIYNWGVKIGQAALDANLPIKLLGATAFINRCPDQHELYMGFNRRLTDVDVMTYGKISSEKIDSFFGDLGFKKQQHFIWHASTRDIFLNEEGLLIDVFRDKLEFCHTIHFKNRLDTLEMTIPLEEMVLQKLQIMTIGDKDFKDLCVLFLQYDVVKGEKGGVDASYIAKLLSKDWGFYYTCITNLNKLKDHLVNVPELTDENKSTVRSKTDKLIQVIEDHPKTLLWGLRSKIGTRMLWYKEVEEIER